MNKEEYRCVIDEFFFHIHYRFYKENGIININTYNPDMLSRLGLPINADYTEIKKKFRELAQIIGSFIQNMGYSVLPIPAAERIDDERICASFSHKLGARLAGLGWIGKSCLLITPQHGPRVRWTSILTDAPIEPTGKPMEENCGSCNECVKICPTHAFTGRTFNPDELREARYNARKCEKYFEMMKENGQIAVCGMCLYVCPYGRKHWG